MLKFNKLFIIFIITTSLLLTACSNETAKQVHLNLRYITANSAPVDINNFSAQAQIAEASTAVSQSLEHLTAIQMAKNPDIKMPPPQATCIGNLSHQASLNWNGPIEPALAKIAQAAHYRFRVLGSSPMLPILVNVNANNQSLGFILRDLIFQAAPSATIKVYARRRLIELRYNQSLKS